jgi:hypothetical protein
VVVLPAALFTSAGPVGLATPPSGASRVGEQQALPRGDAGGPAAAPVRPDHAAAGNVAADGIAAATAPGLTVRRTGDAWLRPEPFTARADDLGPRGPEGRWRGWWNPDVHGANAPGIGPAGYDQGGATGDDRIGNGYGANGHGAHGHGAHGNGNGATGYAPNGHGSNGHGSNGGNGHARTGPEGVEAAGGGNGANGHLPVGSSHGNGHVSALDAGGPGSADRWPSDPAEPPTEGVWLDGVWLDEAWLDGARTDDARPGRDGAPAETTASGPARPEDASGPVPIADGRSGVPLVPGPARPGDVDAPAEGPRIPGSRRESPVPGRREPAPVDPAVRGEATGPRPFPAVPTAMTPPAPALPMPRADEPPTPEPPAGRSSPGSPRGRGLRRRVPQSHLAPELRHLANGGLAETAAPLSADTAATALSRYQASRLAAQAVVDVPADSRSSSEEGERA